MMKFGGYKALFCSCFIVVVSILIALYSLENGILSLKRDIPANRTHFLKKSPVDEDSSTLYVSTEDIDRWDSLQYDYYMESCPSVEDIITKAIKDIHNIRPSIAPSLLRLLFHDCFIGGCDASVLLNSNGSLTSEKEAAPNKSLKGLEVINAIKAYLESVCPGIVSCADILALATREAVILVGGPSYPLETGRRDSILAFKEAAQSDLPSPHANLSVILERFASRGFSEQETVTLLGAHSIGISHCQFFQNRLYNFSGTGKPDPELDSGFLQELRIQCPLTPASASSPSPSPSPSPGTSYSITSENQMDRVVDLSFDNEGGVEDFGTRFFRRLLQNKAVLFSDQQLLADGRTRKWVEIYASNSFLFRSDFSEAMVKLSNLGVLTGSRGEVRLNCTKPN